HLAANLSAVCEAIRVTVRPSNRLLFKSPLSTTFGLDIYLRHYDGNVAHFGNSCPLVCATLAHDFASLRILLKFYAISGASQVCIARTKKTCAQSRIPDNARQI